MVMRYKIGSSRSRRLLAFQASMFSMLLVLPSPVNIAGIPLFLGLKMYKLFMMYLGFKMLLDPYILPGIAHLLVALPGLVETRIESQIAVPLIVSTSVWTVTQLGSPIIVNSANLIAAGVGSVTGMVVDGTILYFIFIAPIIYVRRKIYPRIKHLVK